MAKSLVKEFLDVVKLSESKLEGKNELVLDSILTHFGYDDCDLKDGVERLYTHGKIKHTFRSTLNKCEDMPAVLDWFKGAIGLTDEEIDAEKAKVAAYGTTMLDQYKKYAAMGHKICSKTYLDLAAKAGNAEAQAILADRAYAKTQVQQADKYLAMGHVFCGRKYLELATAKGCPVAAAKLADLDYAENMMKMAKKFLGMGHKISGKKYLELAAAKGYVKAEQKLADMAYVQNMMKMADKFLGMGHKISGKKYVELAAAKGCPCAKAKLATL